ncbi:SLBB domain protein [Pseudobythopirellula maris]|uniref:SLBB domain protein n=1 Tax=Pseudobythopirellula maris TaxID=2527991 RepID=A0A5C5ZJ03_9BACT|nr:SLBB domain-containing protein [Pseudobythopirellula maris]TWT87105.1 SLBB domain protein [Pseudobythopirellula maris]
MLQTSHISRWLILLSLLALVLTGCQSARYAAGSLPAEYLADAKPGSHQIQLAGSSEAASSSNKIVADDLLAIRVVTGAREEPSEPFLVRVEADGRVNVPVVGAVPVVGVDTSEAGRRIAAAAVDRRVYRSPNVTVAVEEQATHRVTVLGAVAEPGVHEIPRGNCDVITAIASAGGTTEEAGTVVEVKHASTPGGTLFAGAAEGGVQQVAYQEPSGPVVERIDLAMASPQQRTKQRLSDSDVVMVLPREKETVHVTGLVTRPDQFELPRDQPLRVLDAIAMAGGITTPVADKVLVIRHIDAHSEPITIGVSMARAKRDGRENLVLRSGDLVSVESTVATTVTGVMKDFFRITMGVSSQLTAF